MYRSLYTGSMPTQMPTHAHAEWKGCPRGSFPGLGAYAGAAAGFFVRWSRTWWMMKICRRNKNLHCFRACLQAYEDCTISGQQPTQLHTEFPRIHNVGHSKIRRLQLKSFLSSNSCKWKFSQCSSLENLLHLHWPACVWVTIGVVVRLVCTSQNWFSKLEWGEQKITKAPEKRGGIQRKEQEVSDYDKIGSIY